MREEDGTATHSSILAWRILCTEEPDGLQSIALQRSGRDWSDWAHMHAMGLDAMILVWCMLNLSFLTPFFHPHQGFLLNFFLITFWAALGLCCFAWTFSSCWERGLLFVWSTDFSLQWLLLLWSTDSRLVGFSSCSAQAFSCSAACGIFPDQGLNLWPWPWQADSYPLHHQGSPVSP